MQPSLWLNPCKFVELSFRRPCRAVLCINKNTVQLAKHERLFDYSICCACSHCKAKSSLRLHYSTVHVCDKLFTLTGWSEKSVLPFSLPVIMPRPQKIMTIICKDTTVNRRNPYILNSSPRPGKTQKSRAPVYDGVWIALLKWSNLSTVISLRLLDSMFLTTMRPQLTFVLCFYVNHGILKTWHMNC